jgi:O-acetyl-ADP-ribose deacetylase (regulator of RNase III)
VILPATGNLLDAPVEALVNTVNTVGVMGKGIALQFARAFPEVERAYIAACEAGEVRPGAMFIRETDAVTGPRYIVNFPTKRHWRGRSRMEDIESGLAALVADVRRLGIRSIAVPPLGCGNGGLDWQEVRPRIERAFDALPEVEVRLYAPQGAPAAAAMPSQTKRPRVTAAVAAMVGIMARYSCFDYRLSLLEIHKLTYFLKEAGEPMPRTEFAAGPYGPYADNLRHVLNRLEGHFLTGWGDGTANQPGTPIHLIPGASEEVESHLAESVETLARFERVSALIEGFETPYGLELLSTVHWIATHDGGAPDVAALERRVAEWSPRKARLFSTEHLRLALDRLRGLGWAA